MPLPVVRRRCFWLIAGMFFAACWGAAAVAPLAAQDPPAAEDKPAPPAENPFPGRFPAPSLDGGVEWFNTSAPIDIRELRGKIVVLDFWATWCGPCIAAMPGLAALAREHAAEVEVIAINLDDAAEARAIFDRSGYQMRLVADDGTISQRYGVTTIPHTVVIDRAGIVRSVHRGGGKAAEHEVERMLDAEIAK